MNPDSTHLLIRTVDGDKHEFALPPQFGGPEYTIGSRMEKLLSQRSVALAAGDRLVIIPMEQIKSIEVFPLQAKLPENIVPSVTAIHSSMTERTPSSQLRIKQGA